MQHPTVARKAALALLEAVLIRQKTLDESFTKLCDDGILSAVPSRERAFARAIASCTLRHLGEIDFLIRNFLEKHLPKDAAKTELILRSAIAELMFLKVPAYAAVNDAVAAASRSRAPTRHHTALVNAVLRRVAKEGEDLLKDTDAGALNIPEWIFQRWCQTYGEETARAIAQAHLNDSPVLDLTLKAPENVAALAERLDGEALPGGSLRLKQGGALDVLEGFGEGEWWVQDAAATLPARLLGPKAQDRVIDLCAAPGGKTAQLCAMGARVTAVERVPARIRRIKENLTRLHLKAEIVQADMLEWTPPEQAPFVLLDAPCSATGTGRRHPDMLYLKMPLDIAALATLQAALLERAAGMVSAGGRLVYCVCSLEKEEGEDIIENFLRSRPDFQREKIKPEEVPGLADALSEAGDLRTLPSQWAERGGIDGFYIARLRKN